MRPTISNATLDIQSPMSNTGEVLICSQRTSANYIKMRIDNLHTVYNKYTTTYLLCNFEEDWRKSSEIAHAKYRVCNFTLVLVLITCCRNKPFAKDYLVVSMY